jgi:tripartite-type tricarboxylate transporter receptor subunit TctC
MFKSLPYDTLKDFAPISTLATSTWRSSPPGDSRFKTLAEVLAYAKANPGKLNIGTINVGSSQNLAAQNCSRAAPASMRRWCPSTARRPW